MLSRFVWPSFLRYLWFHLTQARHKMFGLTFHPAPMSTIQARQVGMIPSQTRPDLRSMLNLPNEATGLNGEGALKEEWSLPVSRLTRFRSLASFIMATTAR